MTADEFKRVTEVTYLGTVHGTLAALTRMRRRDRGAIVQVGSALAYRSIPLQSAYCAAKHAVRGFTDSLRCELIHERSRIHLTMVHMPALNTPQFGWVKSRLAHKAQPVPPIFQPEVAARAICWAADHRRREVLVGAPTVAAIVGNKVAPGLLDRYLGRTGYASQQTPEPEDPARPDNLWSPVDGDHGAHGTFDARSSDHSAELWAATHVREIALSLLGVAGLAGCGSAPSGIGRGRSRRASTPCRVLSSARSQLRDVAQCRRGVTAAGRGNGSPALSFPARSPTREGPCGIRRSRKMTAGIRRPG